MLFGEQLQQAVLGVVGVLVLVDEDVAEGAAPAFARLVGNFQHVDGADQQVVEVHRVGLEHAFLIKRIEVGDGFLKWVAFDSVIGIRIDQLVLGAGDLRAQRPRRVAFRIDPELGHAAFEHPQRVRLVVDREGAGVTELLGIGTQHPRAGGVEGGHPHRPHRAADQGADPLAHLAGSLVGECNREDLAWAGRAGRQQVGDAVGEHPGLARAGAGKDQQWPLAVNYGLPLGLVEPGEQALGAVGTGFDRGPAGLFRALRRSLELTLKRHQPSIARGSGGAAPPIKRSAWPLLPPLRQPGRAGVLRPPASLLR